MTDKSYNADSFETKFSFYAYNFDNLSIYVDEGGSLRVSVGDYDQEVPWSIVENMLEVRKEIIKELRNWSLPKL